MSKELFDKFNSLEVISIAELRDCTRAEQTIDISDDDIHEFAVSLFNDAV